MNMVQSHSLKEAYERIANLPYDSKEQNELKSTLPFWTPHCKEFQNNHRNRESVQQTLRRVMVDIDHNKGRAQEICQKALHLQKQGFWRVLLVEESGAYTLCQSSDGQVAAQDRIGKDRLGKVSSGKDRSEQQSAGDCSLPEAGAMARPPTATEVMIYVKQKKYHILF